MVLTLVHGGKLEPAVPVTQEIQDTWAELLAERLRDPATRETAVAAINECKETGELQPAQVARLGDVYRAVRHAEQMRPPAPVLAGPGLFSFYDDDDMTETHDTPLNTAL